ncbi:response regulator transcription factor [Alkalicoccus daliensis]|uniref:Response regulator receiver domain-containing protein n=1 Tax=Alkalicoccus daliensis TaxID=745820 RepID=A0A1H0K6N6_9BACI|nr:response regulator [Alkalicoccus daliensis]SDO51527.1 Response regulator receiver domain-containing protein [Alkalicoccus daliensis]
MKRILVADDEEILRMLIVDTLEDLGYEIEEAENGEEALTKLQAENYDLVILDYMMPGKTGMEVLQALSSDIKENTYIIMLTAKAQDQDKQRALSEGASYFVAKPFSPQELESLVGGIL